MKSDVVRMDWRRKFAAAREWLFPWLWKASILALPWQTRLFFSSEWQRVPWDTGRAAVYGSWFVLLATILVAPPTFMEKGSWWRRIGVGLVSVSVVAGLFSGWPVPVLQVACQWLILGGFCWTLGRSRVPVEEVTRWFIWAILPQAALGIWQYWHQVVVGSSWFGMAAQDPATLGVSVVEVMGRRVLRAYGAMPHPNILGAWMALGSVLAVCSVEKMRQRVWMSSFANLLFVAALVVSFSRGAWLGWVLAMGWMAITQWRNKRVMAVLLLGVACFGFGAWSERAVISPRIAVESRLEVKSVDERRDAIERGFGAWETHPWFGVGLGRAAFVGWKSGEPYVLPPPHLVLLVGLEELGLVGAFGLLLVFWSFRPAHSRWIQLGPFGMLIFVLSFFDHFLWTFWPGQVLLAFSAYFWIIYLDNHEKTGRVGEPHDKKRRPDVTGKKATA